jgi:hypothetical protein
MTFPEVEALGSAVSDKRSGVSLESLVAGSSLGMEICMCGRLCRIGDIAVAAIGDAGDVRGRSRNSSCSVRKMSMIWT